MYIIYKSLLIETLLLVNVIVVVIKSFLQFLDALLLAWAGALDWHLQRYLFLQFLVEQVPVHFGFVSEFEFNLESFSEHWLIVIIIIIILIVNDGDHVIFAQVGVGLASLATLAHFHEIQ